MRRRAVRGTLYCIGHVCLTIVFGWTNTQLPTTPLRTLHVWPRNFDIQCLAKVGIAKGNMYSSTNERNT